MASLPWHYGCVNGGPEEILLLHIVCTHLLFCGTAMALSLHINGAAESIELCMVHPVYLGYALADTANTACELSQKMG